MTSEDLAQAPVLEMLRSTIIEAEKLYNLGRISTRFPEAKGRAEKLKRHMRAVIDLSSDQSIIEAMEDVVSLERIFATAVEVFSTRDPLQREGKMADFSRLVMGLKIARDKQHA